MKKHILLITLGVTFFSILAKALEKRSNSKECCVCHVLWQDAVSTDKKTCWDKQTLLLLLQDQRGYLQVKRCVAVAMTATWLTAGKKSKIKINITSLAKPLILFVHHIIYLAYVIYKNQIVPLQKRWELSAAKVLKLFVTQPLVPNLKDAMDIIALAKYLLFLTNERPRGDEYTWKEKFDYWAPFWGVMMCNSCHWDEGCAKNKIPRSLYTRRPKL